MLGWREWIALPDLGIDAIKAKVDTGARTSALHAFKMKTFVEDGVKRVRFQVHPLQRRKRPSIECEAEVIDERRVTSSNGQKELRLVIRTRMEVGGKSWPVELTLNQPGRNELPHAAWAAGGQGPRDHRPGALVLRGHDGRHVGTAEKVFRGLNS